MWTIGITGILTASIWYTKITSKALIAIIYTTISGKTMTITKAIIPTIIRIIRTITLV
jgi:hypothetical protein